MFCDMPAMFGIYIVFIAKLYSILLDPEWGIVFFSFAH